MGVENASIVDSWWIVLLTRVTVAAAVRCCLRLLDFLDCFIVYCMVQSKLGVGDVMSWSFCRFFSKLFIICKL